MIIARAPFRVTFGSGVVDVLAARASAPTCALSAALGTYVYATAHTRADSKVVAGYAKREIVDNVDQLENALIKACMKRVSFESGIELHFVSELPIATSGMGGSAAAIAAALIALWGIRGYSLTPGVIAEQAAKVEIEDLGRAVGKQDHYAAAYGGLQHLTFQSTGRVTSNSMPVSMLDFLSGLVWLIPCHVDKRDSSSLLTEQVKNADSNAAERLTRLCQLADGAIRGQNLQSVIGVLNEAWDVKKGLSSNVSSPDIDAVINQVRFLGGGAKLCGAGGGGYVLAVVTQARIADLLAAFPLSVRASMTGSGAQVVFDDGQREYAKGKLRL